MLKRGQIMGGRGATSSLGGGRGKPNEATEYYVSGEGMWINQYLRGKGDFGELSEGEKEYLKDLDKATDGKVGERTLWRNVDASAIFGNMNDGDYENIGTVLTYGENAFGKGAYAESIVNRVNNIIQKTTGKTITEKGFMSTTSDENIAKEWGDFTGSEKPIVMKIKTNSKTKGVNLSGYDKNVSADQAQKETLLGRNQSFNVNKIYSKDGQIYVDVEMNG